MAGCTRLRHGLLLLGVAGAALFYGDSIITPAISVLGAMEGLSVLTPALTPWVLLLSLVVLVGLFVVQRFGIAVVGRWFGLVILLWFATLAAIVLALTGAEALHADMGHFGRRPIQWAWCGLVRPGAAGAGRQLFFDGGWFALAVAGLLVGLMATWAAGRLRLLQSIRHDGLALQPFIAGLGATGPGRASGTAISLVADTGTVPQALLHNLKHNQVLHDRTVVLTVVFADQP